MSYVFNLLMVLSLVLTPALAEIKEPFRDSINFNSDGVTFKNDFKIGDHVVIIQEKNPCEIFEFQGNITHIQPDCYYIGFNKIDQPIYSITGDAKRFTPLSCEPINKSFDMQFHEKTHVNNTSIGNNGSFSLLSNKSMNNPLINTMINDNRIWSPESEADIKGLELQSTTPINNTSIGRGLIMSMRLTET